MPIRENSQDFATYTLTQNIFAFNRRRERIDKREESRLPCLPTHTKTDSVCVVRYETLLALGDEKCVLYHEFKFDRAFIK